MFIICPNRTHGHRLIGIQSQTFAFYGISGTPVVHLRLMLMQFA